jgi:P-type Cu+ transporter
MIKEAYLIEGLTCPFCERAIQKAVTHLDGVQSAEVDLKAASISFEYDPARVSIDDIKDTVSKIGYHLADKKPPGNKEPQDPVG